MVDRFDVGYVVFGLVVLVFVLFFVIVCIDGYIFYFIYKEKKMRQVLI